MRRNNVPLKGVFFDAGDTLFEAKKSIGFYYSQIASRYGVQIEATTLNTRFKNAFQKAPPLAFPHAEKETLPRLEYAWWRRLVRDVFFDLDFPHFDAFFEELYAFFESEDPWRLFPETRSVLFSLKEMDLKLGIISNFDSRLLSICRHLGIDAFFDVIVFSSQSCVAKPHPEIFEWALTQSGLNPSEVVYVGDQYQNDVVGPQSAGMKALLIERNPRSLGHPKTSVTRDLRGVLPFISELLMEELG